MAEIRRWLTLTFRVSGGQSQVNAWITAIAANRTAVWYYTACDRPLPWAAGT